MLCECAYSRCTLRFFKHAALDCMVGERRNKPMKRSISATDLETHTAEEILSRSKRFALLVGDTPQPGVNTWDIAADGPVTVGWSSLLSADRIPTATQEEVIVSCLRVSSTSRSLVSLISVFPSS